MQLTTATTEFFGTPVRIIDHAGQRWLTAEEVGLCLGYTPGNARQGIGHLYRRHEDEFTEADTCEVNLASQGQSRAMRIFSATGCQLLGFFANTERAKQFRAWAKSVLAGTPVAATPARRSQSDTRPAITRAVEFEVLTLFAQGWPQSAIAKQLRISSGTVSLLVHARYRFTPDAGHDLTTPALRQAVVDRHMADERARLIRKYCASAVNGDLAHCLDHAGLRLLVN